MRIILRIVLDLGKVLRIKKGRYDETIKEILREEKITRVSLIQKCLEKGIPKSTAYGRVTKFIERGDFQSIEYLQLSEKYAEADRNVVIDYIQTIKESENLDILESRIHALGFLSQDARLIHYPGVLLFFEELFDKPHFRDNEQLFNEIIYTLFNILRFERLLSHPDSEVYISALTTDILRKILLYFKNTPKIPRGYALSYLREAGKKEAVDVIFDKLDQGIKAVDIANVSYALGQNGLLYKHHHGYIEKKIDELLSNDDAQVKEVGKNLRINIMQQGARNAEDGTTPSAYKIS